MNERIKQLASEAKLEHCVSHVRLQHFAELIVKECASICEQNEHFNKFSVASDWSLKAAEAFKKHLGVE